MYKRFLYLVLVFLLPVRLNVTAQEPVSSNGKFATINGLKIYYEESGKGTPIILLHHFFASASLWKNYIPELAKKYRVIAIDLPGHGRSDYIDTTREYLHKKVSQYIIGLINFLKLDSVYLMGASSGAVITLYLSTLRPDLVKRAVIIGGHLYYFPDQREMYRKISIDLDANIPRHGKEKALLLGKQFNYGSDLYGDPAFTPDMLARIRAKTLIIHGDHDTLAPVENALQMYEHIPNAFLWIVPNGDHFPLPPYLDSKNETDFVKRTMEFLNGNWDKK